jgi:hypothetical protein
MRAAAVRSFQQRRVGALLVADPDHRRPRKQRQEDTPPSHTHKKKRIPPSPCFFGSPKDCWLAARHVTTWRGFSEFPGCPLRCRPWSPTTRESWREARVEAAQQAPTGRSRAPAIRTGIDKPSPKATVLVNSSHRPPPPLGFVVAEFLLPYLFFSLLLPCLFDFLSGRVFVALSFGSSTRSGRKFVGFVYFKFAYVFRYGLYANIYI